MANTFDEYALNPDKYTSIVGIPAEITARLPGFADFGISGNVMVDVIRNTISKGKPGSIAWSESLIAHADSIASQANSSEASWLEASFWYFFARFPHIMNERMAVAYERHKTAYLKANEYSQFPLKVLEVPFAGNTVSCYLRLPKSKKNQVPVVVIWGGIDIWKSDLEIHSQGNAILENDIAVLAVDIPGTGGAPIPASSTAQRWFLAIFDCIKLQPELDASRIACYGLSFGGYWACKLALLAPWLKGVVNVGGPVHHTFSPQWMKKLPVGIVHSLSRVCGLKPHAEAADVFSQCASLSLKLQRHLPTTEHAPVLSINGSQDKLVSIDDLYYLQQQGVKQDVLVFANDRHVASRNWGLHEKFVVNWLVRKLK